MVKFKQFQGKFLNNSTLWRKKMKTLIFVVTFITLLAMPAMASVSYIGGDNNGLCGSSQKLTNGVYDDWVDIITPTTIFDMGSPTAISSVGVHEHTYNSTPWYNFRVAAVGRIDIQFSNYADFSYTSSFPTLTFQFEYDNNVSLPPDDVLWVQANFDPVTARYCQIFVSSTCTYVQADEFSINGLDGTGNPVPEPTSLTAFCGGVAGLLAFRRRR
jgi:hypothetical protein